ncbi:MAG: FISUMP domain-containing protein, partial [Patescibacteria group bacterium]
EYDEEQLFTWQAAMRETKKAGKRMPTDEEFTELLKTKSDMPNIVLAGYRDTDGSFSNQSSYAYFWSSAESSTYAWTRLLSSSYATVYRHALSPAVGFSVRCLKD